MIRGGCCPMKITTITTTTTTTTTTATRDGEFPIPSSSSPPTTTTTSLQRMWTLTHEYSNYHRKRKRWTDGGHGNNNHSRSWTNDNHNNNNQDDDDNNNADDMLLTAIPTTTTTTTTTTTIGTKKRGPLDGGRHDSRDRRWKDDGDNNEHDHNYENPWLVSPRSISCWLPPTQCPQPLAQHHHQQQVTDHPCHATRRNRHMLSSSMSSSMSLLLEDLALLNKDNAIRVLVNGHEEKFLAPQWMEHEGRAAGSILAKLVVLGPRCVVHDEDDENNRNVRRISSSTSIRHSSVNRSAKPTATRTTIRTDATTTSYVVAGTASTTIQSSASASGATPTFPTTMELSVDEALVSSFDLLILWLALGDSYIQSCLTDDNASQLFALASYYGLDQLEQAILDEEQWRRCRRWCEEEEEEEKDPLHQPQPPDKAEGDDDDDLARTMKDAYETNGCRFSSPGARTATLPDALGMTQEQKQPVYKTISLFAQLPQQQQQQPKLETTTTTTAAKTCASTIFTRQENAMDKTSDSNHDDDDDNDDNYKNDVSGEYAWFTNEDDMDVREPTDHDDDDTTTTTIYRRRYNSPLEEYNAQGYRSTLSW